MAHWNDYVAFTYGDQYSADLNLYRVSSGSRYELNLLPSLEEIVENVPGGDGQYYFGTNYRGSTFTLNLAFDRVTEEDIRGIRAMFNGREVKPLIFDELPYKIYYAKVTRSTLSFIPFLEENDVRVYKGDGVVQFVLFSPYAQSRFKWLEDYNGDNIPEWLTNTGNLMQWLEGSKIIPKGNHDVFSGGKYLIYNGGDIETFFQLEIPFVENSIGTSGGSPYFSIATTSPAHILKTGKIDKRGTDAKIRIDTKTNVIEGLSAAGHPTGQLYNDLITEGFFFKLPLGEGELTVTGGTPSSLVYHFWYL